MPKISVVTSVYNCEEYIGETIESVLRQDFVDWEFILIDDCSTDRSSEIIKSYSENDGRIKYYVNETNQGQPSNLNKGIQLATGKYIARLDHDDICEPTRFTTQYMYMEDHPDVVLLGANNFNLMNGVSVSRKMISSNDSELRFLMAFGIQDLIHSCFFIRKSAMIDNNIWYRNYEYAEDYGLYGDLFSIGNVHIIDECLVTYRIFDGNTTSKTPQELRYNEMRDIIFRYVDTLKIEDTEIYRKSIEGKIEDEEDLNRLEKWVAAYAEHCKLGNDIEDIRKNKYVKFALFNLFIWQKGSFTLWKAYHDSKMNYGFSNCRMEFKMLKHCMTNNKKRLLWYSGKETLE